jgi:hypothetical protein
MKKVGLINVTYVKRAILINEISENILNQFMKERSLTNATSVMQILPTKKV